MDLRSTKPVVIKRVSRSIVVLVAILVTPPVVGALATRSIFSPIWFWIGLAIVIRVSQLKLSVSSDGVRVQNFFKTTTVPIWEAEAEIGEQEASLFLGDSDGGKFDRGGRTLFIRRLWHNNDRLHIGVAPRYGPEVERIHEELVDAIMLQRAA